MEQILFIGVVVLLIFGPEKVPEIARALGNLTREFQDALHPAEDPGPPGRRRSARRPARRRPKRRAR